MRLFSCFFGEKIVVIWGGGGFKNLDLRSVCLLESIFFKKINSRKVNYFLIFGNIVKNKLKNTFQYLIML